MLTRMATGLSALRRLGDASFDELSLLAEGAVYERLALIDGIAEVTVQGNRANEFRVTLELPSLISRGLTIFDVSDALADLRDNTTLGTTLRLRRLKIVPACCLFANEKTVSFELHPSRKSKTHFTSYPERARIASVSKAGARGEDHERSQ